jgi:hypothetical protein
MFLYTKDDQFTCRRITFVGHGMDRNQYIGFRKIGGCAGLWNIEPNYDKAFRNTFNAFVVVYQIYHITGFQTLFFKVPFIHKDNPTFIQHPPVAVVHSVNRSIELIMATYSHHHELALLQMVNWQL